MKKTLDFLRKKGKRITKARAAVAAVVMIARGPLSVDEIHALVIKKRVACDRTTVYRELMMLVREGLLSEGRVKSVTRYEANMRHHHHAVCVSCDAVIDLEIAHELKGFSRVLSSMGWSDVNHFLELYGTCPKCKKEGVKL